ncbi:hypothetical protein ADL04_27735 [Streptomyces sp. NRRL B-3648]|nr:hypothetical protein ADL04_27735 [Streptomyces sp. NRRL B-3648]
MAGAASRRTDAPVPAASTARAAVAASPISPGKLALCSECQTSKSADATSTRQRWTRRADVTFTEGRGRPPVRRPDPERFRWSWLEPVIPVLYALTLGPVRREDPVPDLFEAGCR